MKGFATVNMAGRLTADPEVRYRTTGDPVASWCIAVSRTIQGDLQSRQWTDYIDCIRVGDGALELAAEYHKGCMVEICGRLIQQRWEERGYKKSRLCVDVATISQVRRDEVEEISCT